MLHKVEQWTEEYQCQGQNELPGLKGLQLPRLKFLISIIHCSNGPYISSTCSGWDL